MEGGGGGIGKGGSRRGEGGSLTKTLLRSFTVSARYAALWLIAEKWTMHD